MDRRIETERLLLRLPRAEDRPALHAMWADPEVMRNLGPVLDAAGGEAILTRHAGYNHEGLGFSVVERRSDGAVIGHCGLKRGNLGSPIVGLVEIGWMFGQEYWGQGYAAEAARASLAWGWANIVEDRIVAITAARNLASQRLMERLGMARVEGGDFEHQNFAAGDPLRPTVTYDIHRPA